MPDSSRRDAILRLLAMGILVGYIWDRRTARFRRIRQDGRLGRYVTEDEIFDGLRDIVNTEADRLAQVAEAVVLGLIAARVFQEWAMLELKAFYNTMSALAVGGWVRMTAVEWGENGRILRTEYRYLASFCLDLEAGKLTVKQARSRARLYVGKAYSRFWAEYRRLRQRSGYTQERWVDTGDERMCPDCPPLAARGWVPIGSTPTVPGAGDTACMGNCRCRMIFR